jgi:hypothetical protein
MKFKVGDTIILNEETELYFFYKRTDIEYTEKIMKIEGKFLSAVVCIDVNTNSYEYIETSDMYAYRLVTEKELKLNKIKKMFINE